MNKWEIFIGGNTYYGNTYYQNRNDNESIKGIEKLNDNLKLYYTSVSTTHFICYNSSIYDKYIELESNLNTEKFNINEHMIDVYPRNKFKIITPIPFIAIQDESYSDLEKKNTNYTYLFSKSEEIINSIDIDINKYTHINNQIFYDENNKLIDKYKEEFIEQEQVKKYLDKDSVVLELGARYGTVSCIINKIINNPNNQVSVEPDIRVFEALKKNMNNNKCNFHIIEGFISNNKMDLINKDDWHGYGTSSIKSDNTDIKNYKFDEIEKLYNLKFDTLIADCEGFLEIFFDENPKLYNQLKCIIMEYDYPTKCNYDKIVNNLILNEFKLIHDNYYGLRRSVWKK